MQINTLYRIQLGHRENGFILLRKEREKSPHGRDELKFEVVFL